MRQCVSAHVRHSAQNRQSRRPQKAANTSARPATATRMIHHMTRHFITALLALLVAAPVSAQFGAPLNVTVPTVSSDPEIAPVDIVYVRTPRDAAKPNLTMAEVAQPRTQAPGGDLVFRAADGTETVLVDVTAPQTVVDPMVSPDGAWVYYSLFYDGLNPKGADIFKVEIATKQVVQITFQEWTPNRPGQPRPLWGVFNTGPAPGPNGTLAFVSDRNGYESTNPGYALNALALQLTVLDEHTGDVEVIGPKNLGSALHPVWLRDGRIMYSTLESQGIRSPHLWGLWVINPDGTAWAPLASAFDWGGPTANTFHFQTQVTDGRVVFESYYNVNNRGMGPLYALNPGGPPSGTEFGPAWTADPRNTPQRHGRQPDGKGTFFSYPFTRLGLESLTPFVVLDDYPSQTSILGDTTSPRVGKFTHPSAAPENHLLAVWSAGSVQSNDTRNPLDLGIYLIKGTQPIAEPAAMRLVVNDPAYHEMWPRAVASWERIYGAPLPDLGRQRWSLDIPDGAPWGWVGTSSNYKRESAPRGCVKPGTVTSVDCQDNNGLIEDFNLARYFNWEVQGADAGLYANGEIAAIRILHFEPTPEFRSGRTYYNHAREKVRILGEIPLRKFKADGTQPLDPDGNPDTSVKVAIPADVAWTFDLIDKHGRTLTRAQTWHQVRPGETRVNCGGCHAHSQKPTDFALTRAAAPDYQPFDLTKQRYPLLTTKANDESGQRWNTEDDLGVRFVSKPESPEWHRDIKPLLVRTGLFAKTSDPNLVGIDPADETPVSAYSNTAPAFSITLPKGYAQICVDANGALHPVKPAHSSGYRNAGMKSAMSRLVRAFQSRRSPLIWALYGARLDGVDNEAFPHQKILGDDTSWSFLGKPVPSPNVGFHREFNHVAYVGNGVPAEGFTEDERMMVSRFVDLGCPIELKPGGWHDDTQRPTLVVTPHGGTHEDLTQIILGLHDINSGLNPQSLSVTADVDLDGQAAGTELASKFVVHEGGRWIWTFSKPLPALERVRLTVSIADNAGNVATRRVTFATDVAVVPEATFVGFEDVQGDLRSRVPDGKLDYHFRLTGLQKRPIAFIDVKAGSDSDGTSFKWSNVAGEESPQHPEGKWWLITYTPPLTAVGDTRDIWFANPFPDRPYTDFRIYVVYDERNIEDRDFMRATSPTPPPPRVDCVLAWPEAWSACVDGQQSRTQTVLTPAQHGGACAPQTETRACTVEPPPTDWKAVLEAFSQKLADLLAELQKALSER
jgi:hypothetical protein